MNAIPKLAGEEDRTYEKHIKDGGKYTPKKKFPNIEEVLIHELGVAELS